VSDPAAFRFAGLEIRQPEARYPWQQKYNAVHADWPPKGLHLIMRYAAPLIEKDKLSDLQIEVHYEMYQGLPVMAKWLTVKNDKDNPIVVTEVETEILAIAQDQVTRIHTESDYSFALANANPLGSGLMHFQKIPEPYQAGASTTRWLVDKEYNSWA